MLTSCSVRSTVDASSEPAWILPRLEVSGMPVRGVPELKVSTHRLLPFDSSPCGLLKVVSAPWPSGLSAPVE
ncbi:hypothetical protein G6F60_015785 [Rhizopus arrhizus]|nr:hypothetical protein G6F60_015785 [Rhizopus arrhizus]